ncbi:MAG TPA: M23 family metallopeptidase [Blastocatellia bacterium]|nr:M23 family metallopeptidase [Blastocatellia bacterium]
MRIRPSILLFVLLFAGGAAARAQNPGGDDTPTFAAVDTVAADEVVEDAPVQAPLILAPLSIDMLDFGDAVPEGGYAAVTPPAPRISTKVGGSFRLRMPGYASRPAIRGVNSGFGFRSDPITGGTRMHTGVDLKATYGQSVGAAMSGVVAYAQRRGGYGNLVVVDHGGGIFTFYGHLSGIAVQYGQRLLAGQTLGYVGSTGRSTGPHLHYEVRARGVPVNPASAISIDGTQIYADGRLVDGPAIDGGDEVPTLVANGDAATTSTAKSQVPVRTAIASGDSLSSE